MKPSVEFQLRAKPVLRWLLHSFSPSGGSRGYFSLTSGWGAPYPETTGYLIETLLDYQPYFPDLPLSSTALRAGQWLLDSQLPEGGFCPPRQSTPLVFDTGMIIFGLLRLYHHSGNMAYRSAAHRAGDWLYEAWGKQRFWSRYTLDPNWDATYRARVVWALSLLDDERNPLIQLDHYTRLASEGYPWRQAAFGEQGPIWTHTLAYTWRGLWEAGHILKHKEAMTTAVQQLEYWLDLAMPMAYRLAGFDAQGHPIRSFICVPGSAQLAILCLRLYAITNSHRYLLSATSLAATIHHAPGRLPWSGWRGGIPGSLPVWGTYQRGKMINWGAKFYLDLLLAFEQLGSKPGL